MLARDRISHCGTNNAASVWPFVNKLDTFREGQRWRGHLPLLPPAQAAHEGMVQEDNSDSPSLKFVSFLLL